MYSSSVLNPEGWISVSSTSNISVDPAGIEPGEAMNSLIQEAGYWGRLSIYYQILIAVSTISS